MDMLSGISIQFALGIISVLGLPGLVFVIWYVDQKRIDGILKQYKSDMDKVTEYYNRNVELVERYEKLADDLSGIIHLNTQAQTRLVESITNNMFCPVVRQAGPGGR